MPLHVSSTVVLIIRRSKLCYTASDIFIHVGGRLVRRLGEDGKATYLRIDQIDAQSLVL